MNSKTIFEQEIRDLLNVWEENCDYEKRKNNKFASVKLCIEKYTKSTGKDDQFLAKLKSSLGGWELRMAVFMRMTSDCSEEKNNFLDECFCHIVKLTSENRTFI